ncbi:MAG: glycosyltransferase [Myxococcota bacterium]
MTTSTLIILVVYVALLALLSIVSTHRFILSLLARRYRVMPPAPPTEWPKVVVQLPLYNERYVAQRIIDAASKIDYPQDKLEIQVLDDSTDETVDIVKARVDEWKARGTRIEHVRRGSREGFKAGALAAGLKQTDAELVAIFDADFVPPPHFLKALVGHFQEDDVGMVQARWEHLNRLDSKLTDAQAMLLDGHFVNEHGGRVVTQSFFNFNGTAGIWRIRAIEEAGGWSGDTLTEDLDLSYRAQLAGWRFVYRPDVTVPAELPNNVNAFKTQQHRWAKGSIETARKLLPQIWRSKLSLRHKVEATFHLGGNIAYPLVLVLALIMPFGLAARYAYKSTPLSILDGFMLLGSTGALALFYFLAERYAGRPQGMLTRLPVCLAVGVGLAVNNSKAVLEALFKRKSAFARTPKWGGRSAIDASYLLKGQGQALVELVLGIYLAVATVFAAVAWRFVALPFMLLFTAGFFILAWGSLRPSKGTPVSAGALGETLTASPAAPTIRKPSGAAAENHG